MAITFNLQTQQTPNPFAHGPLATPPLSEHSADVRQVPLSPEDAAHTWFWNWTMVKSDKTKNLKKKIKSFILF